MLAGSVDDGSTMAMMKKNWRRSAVAVEMNLTKKF
jgi:hypothetical protein